MEAFALIKGFFRKLRNVLLALFKGAVSCYYTRCIVSVLATSNATLIRAFGDKLQIACLALREK